MSHLLEIDRIAVSYGGAAPVLRGVSLTVDAGETVCLVGESGSGKTTVIRAVMGALPAGGRLAAGSIRFEGQDMAGLSRKAWRALRGTRLSMIFQDAGGTLNPIRTIGAQFVEYIRAHDHGVSRRQAMQRAGALLARVRLPAPDRILASYPHELSGGQRQRVGIALAMAFSPALLLADEPTSALDVTTQAQIVRELIAVRKESGMGMIVVTHNLGVAAYLADRLIVMKDGGIVEQGTPGAILTHPASAYTRALLAAVPEMEELNFAATSDCS